MNLTTLDHSPFMKLALREAQRAYNKDEVPVGAIIVRFGRVIARGFNLTKTHQDPTAHAEMVAIQKAAKKLKNERLLDTILYTTLEPCSMCAGAIVQARISMVVMGTSDPKAGACGSVFRILPNQKLNHRPVVKKDVLKEQCSDLLTSFFKKKREEKRSLK